MYSKIGIIELMACIEEVIGKKNTDNQINVTIAEDTD